MASTEIATIVEQVQKLSSGEQQELRAVLEALLFRTPASIEKEFHQRMAAQKRISVPSPEARSRPRRRLAKPVAVKGQAVSATIIEERR